MPSVSILAACAAFVARLFPVGPSPPRKDWLGGGYVTPAIWGVPNALGRGTTSEVAHKLACWLRNPCRLGGPQRFRAGQRLPVHGSGASEASEEGAQV